jgi:hypothetical protein
MMMIYYRREWPLIIYLPNLFKPDLERGGGTEVFSLISEIPAASAKENVEYFATITKE